MSDEKGEKLDTTEFLSTLLKINERLAAIETATNTFPGKFDKIEDRLERYHESAMSANNKADRAWELAKANEEDLKLANSVAAEAQDAADKALIQVESMSKELKEYKDNTKQDQTTNKGVWVAIASAILSGVITIWTAVK